MKKIIEAHKAVLTAIHDGNPTEEASAAFMAAIKEQETAHADELATSQTRIEELEGIEADQSSQVETLNTNVAEQTERADNAEAQVAALTEERDSLNTQVADLTTRNEELANLAEDQEADLNSSTTLEETMSGAKDGKDLAFRLLKRQVEQN